MAKISTYPEVVPPSLDDFVVGTDVSDSLATKSFQISDILSLGIGVAPTLQQVTNAGATTTTQITTTGFIKTGGTSSQFLKADGSTSTVPYKVYTALLEQSGTDAPVATILENTLGGVPVWSYVAVGIYMITLNGAFTPNKTMIMCSIPSSISGINNRIILYDDEGVYGDNMTIEGYDNADVPTNGLVNQYIEIRVYN